MVLFSLKDLLLKINQERWLGSIKFYPSGEKLSKTIINEHQTWLEENINFKFGDRVVVVATPKPETIVTLLWLWNKGIVVVPVKHNANPDGIKNIANDCHAKAIIKSKTILNINSLMREVIKFNVLNERQVCGSDLAMIIYTSGSTGTPKGIMLSHNNVISAIYSIGNYLRIDSHEHILGLSPLSFDYGLYQVLFSIAYDCELTLFEESYHPIKVLKAIEALEITLLPVVPSMATSLAKVIKIFKKSLPNLKKLTNTGGHLGENVVDELLELLPDLKVFAMYGLTECKRALFLPPEEIRQKRGSVGIPIPGLEAKLFRPVDADGQQYYQEVDTGDVGELFVRGSTVMQGYYGDKVENKNIISGSYRDDNWLATGDLFVRDLSGYFYFKGRSKELIKQAGFCIYPTEVEAIIEKHSMISLAAIVPTKDKYGDEIACLYVQLHQDSDENQAIFKQWLDTEIESDYRPRQIKFTCEMRLTSNGKIDKNNLVRSL
jgi:acyl-CoA synthetase (AMP-forming)/AMP-acid ligase II